MTINPFKVDDIRNKFLRSNDIDSFYASYKKGAFPELDEMSTVELWDDLAEYNVAPDFRIRRLALVAQNVPKKSKLLDVGVGWGEIIPMLEKQEIAEYVGIDFSEKIINKLSQQYQNHRLLNTTLDQLDESFDVILALEVCEHILATNIVSFYESVQERLNRKGKFIISVPIYENLENITLKCPKCGHLHSRMGHVRSYTPELIKAELEMVGFKILKSSFIYTNFSNSFFGMIKMGIVNLGLFMLRMSKISPLNIVIVAEKKDN